MKDNLIPPIIIGPTSAVSPVDDARSAYELALSAVIDAREASTAAAEARESAKVVADVAAMVASKAADDSANAARAKASSAESVEDAKKAVKVAAEAEKAAADADKTVADVASERSADAIATLQRVESKYRAQVQVAEAAASAASAAGSARGAATATRVGADAGAAAARAALDLAERTADYCKYSFRAASAASRARYADTYGEDPTHEATVARNAAVDAAKVEGKTIGNLVTDKIKQSKKGMVIVAVGALIGAPAGWAAHFLDANIFLFISLAITWFVTVVTIGTSNDFPYIRDKIERFKRIPFSLRTRHIWAAVSMGALSLALMASFPTNSMPAAAPPACLISVNTEEPSKVGVQCGKNVPVQIDLNSTNPESKSKILFFEQAITDTSAYISVDGSSTVKVHTSSNSQICTYSRNLSVMREETKEDCNPK